MRTESPDAVIQVDDLRKRFGEFEAVKGVDLRVAHGETFGFLGPNGAGKSTTISMLCTLLRPTSGRALVAGFDVARHPTDVRRHIGLVFQDTTLDDYLTAEENLRLHAELYGVPRDETRERMGRVLEMVGLSERRRDIVRTFSGGMKRRLEIARGLLHSPRVLFLDEPTVGLDPQTRTRIWEYLGELQEHEDITIFLTTHYMDEAEYCDRIAIIDHGAILVEGTPDELKEAVAEDRITLRTEDDDRAVRALHDRFGLEATRGIDGIAVHASRGEELIPRLVGSLGVTVKAVEMTRPSLDDVFMFHTGRTIRDTEATGAEQLRANPIVRRRR